MPLHDSASNDADAFRYVAGTMREPRLTGCRA
jgi:hypothetical protein